MGTSEADAADGSGAGVAFPVLDETLATDIPAFLAAATNGAGIDFATTLGAVALGAAADVASACDVCSREATLLDGGCLEGDGRTDDSPPPSSFASRKASASFFLFFEAVAEDADDEDDALAD
jgi:hypothetical protein